MIFDSKDEEYFSWWCQELKDAGIIQDYNRSESFQLNKPLIKEFVVEKELKTKIKSLFKKQTLIPIKEYTPDFIIYWKYSVFTFKFAEDLGVQRQINVPFTYGAYRRTFVEVKPIFDQNNMTRLFKTNQAIIWDKYGIYVNLVTYQELFEKTFTPKKFLLTDTGRQERKIKWKVRTLEEYLNG